MAYMVVFIATRWGSEEGGLNVFNTGVALGMAKVLPKGSRCLCFIEVLPSGDAIPPRGIVLLPHDFKPDSIVDDIRQNLSDVSEGMVRGVLVLGHDVKTGDLAIQTAKLLKGGLAKVQVLSAVISHMDYAAYARQKGHDLVVVEQRAEQQRMIIASADLTFAVGPYLAARFRQSSQSQDERPFLKQLTPGAAEIQPVNVGEGMLQVFVSGRLGLSDDTIKNGILSVEALLRAYGKARKSKLSFFRARGRLFVCGVESDGGSSLLSKLERRAAENAMFSIEPVIFTPEQHENYKLLASSHIALMPSWHEGFGLTGWEALCAGVPLVCSKQSGLAMLIEELRIQLPGQSFSNVELIELRGSKIAGEPQESDVDILSEAIVRLAENYGQRKHDALSLAKHLKVKFSWEDCAFQILSETGWPMANSVSVQWTVRRNMAREAAEGREEVAFLLELLDSPDRVDIGRDWSKLCSAFNYVSDAGKSMNAAECKTLLAQLRPLADFIGNVLKHNFGGYPRETNALRDSGGLDVCWRYMAACKGVSSSFSQFTGLLPTNLLYVILSDGFLRKELLFYLSDFSTEFGRSAKSLAQEFCLHFRELLTSDLKLQIRLARLTAVRPDLLIAFENEMPELPEMTLWQELDAYREESERCRTVEMMSYDIAYLIDKDPLLAPTVLALTTLRPRYEGQAVEQAISFFNVLQGQPVTKEWRGDKRLYAALLSVTMPTSKLLAVLEAMASDEEEAIRWAALDLAFSPVLRTRLEAAHAAQGDDFGSLLRKLGRIIDLAVTADGGHPWLAREFLTHFGAEFIDPSQGTASRRFSVLDFPQSRILIGPMPGVRFESLTGSEHPEVVAARKEVRSSVRRVLLVLPPLSVTSGESRGASATSTPPLGLGLLGTHLAVKGHDIHLVDCHRFPELLDDIIELADSYDIIGCNVVISTLRSTMELFQAIRRKTAHPLLIVGGPAANLDVWRFSAKSDEESEAWDFAIPSAAVNALDDLLQALGSPAPWPSTQHLVANPLSQILSFRGIRESLGSLPKQLDLSWMEIDVDRRIYQGPDGVYEPAHTRDLSGSVHEAHVVMSQGCDWNCAFCTERKDLSGGERRRSVEQVLAELERLSSSYRDLRIQFIDDNLLPQISALATHDLTGQAQAKVWTSAFLNGLREVREGRQGSFGWRGIFRVEDFFSYEESFGTHEFVAKLVSSGCRMLAFGLEHGDETRRKRLKAGADYKNAEIVSLFKRLRDAGIQTKAYFMIGGQWETAESALDTIRFALDCGATLAYFALYKEFVKAVHVLSEERGPSSRHDAFAEYSQMAVVWDATYSAYLSDPSMKGLSSPATQIEIESYAQLAKLGFRFSDIVKYNDHHADSDSSSSILSNVTWGEPSEYFSIIETAYRRFYLRPEFVHEYSKLVREGY
ncbi:B12-binding domain-containing radical SAM protein [Pseudomonas fluorescens]|uniref:Uncharacterized protein n=1 Tax=Pseudomonas fluorescens ICMP 11288 TaxID=1198309 RepID=A0A0W0H5W2_PSEFL|nr:radical SAM protein [Pseudomonas fluorescens]KTB56203.1 hypothetical protein AO063_29115 [Pseudomonas fluorescens ICMP 11288]